MKTLSQSWLVQISLFAALAAAIIYWCFGALSPCGILRGTIRQHDGLAAVLPDGLIDLGLSAQYGNLSQGRCLAVLLQPKYTPSVADAGPQAERTKNEIRATQRNELVTGATETAQNMNAFAARINGGMQYFTAVDQRYRAITGNMRRAFSQAHSIFGGGQAAVARSQIYVAINQASVEAEQLHVNVTSTSENFETDVSALMDKYNSLAKSCQSLTEAASRSEMHELNNACGPLLESAKKFQNSIFAARTAFARVEQVWLSEHAMHERILQGANAGN